MSYCLLLAEEGSPDGEQRLETMVASDDGFLLAEKDLELRGPGDFIGTRQSGLPEMQWLDGVFDTRLLDRARRAAEILLAADRAAPDHQRLQRRFADFWERRTGESGLIDTAASPDAAVLLRSCDWTEAAVTASVEVRAKST